jgi:hypothetical protein
MLESSQAHPYLQETLGGMVTQVPENNELHLAQSNPYSPRNSAYYIN